MTTRIDQLDEKLMSGLPEFARKVWNFPDSIDFLRWRIASPPGSVYYVAHDDGRWLAGIGGQHKCYLNEGKYIDCLETYAWASLQVKESKGWGIKAMKALIDHGKPLIALGGSQDTLNFMPRLGFETLASAPSMVLPLRAGFAKEISGAKGLLARLAIEVLSPLTHRRPGMTGGLRPQPLATFDNRTLSMQTLGGFEAVYEPELFDWQMKWAEQGNFIPVRFIRDNRIVGWIFARVAEESPGQIIGRLLEAKFSPDTFHRDHVAMIRALVALLAGFGADAVRALTTCPETNMALKACHFRYRSESPAMVHHSSRIAKDQPIRVSVLRADGGAQPLRPDSLAA